MLGSTQRVRSSLVTVCVCVFQIRTNPSRPAVTMALRARSSDVKQEIPRWAFVFFASTVIEVLDTRNNVSESSEEMEANSSEFGLCGPSVTMLYMYESLMRDNAEDALSWKSLIML